MIGTRRDRFSGRRVWRRRRRRRAARRAGPALAGRLVGVSSRAGAERAAASGWPPAGRPVGPLPQVVAGPDADRRAGRPGLRRGAQRRRRRPGPAGHPGGAGCRPDGRAGQQGVADRRRPAGTGRGRAGPAGAGRLRALGAGPVPARRAAPPRCAGWCSPPAAARSGAAAGPSWPTSPRTQALAHPTWNMGPLITTNSATLVNKGLELIEAQLLFDVAYDRIEVVVHPQSMVHSMVEFVDGATLAQASPPDMRLPIALALGWPDRVPGAAPGLDWTPGASLDVRAAGRRGVPGGRPGPDGRAAPAAARRRSSTRPTRSWWPPFTAEPVVSSASSTPCARCWTLAGRRARRGRQPRDLADVEEAQRGRAAGGGGAEESAGSADRAPAACDRAQLTRLP